MQPSPSNVNSDYKPFPQSPNAARAWIREAIRTGNYTPSVHLRARLAERNLVMDDVRNTILRASTVEPYAGMPQNGGTCWRVRGRVDGKSLAVGVEAYLNEQKRWAIVCTIFAS